MNNISDFTASIAQGGRYSSKLNFNLSKLILNCKIKHLAPHCESIALGSYFNSEGSTSTQRVLWVLLRSYGSYFNSEGSCFNSKGDSKGSKFQFRGVYIQFRGICTSIQRKLIAKQEDIRTSNLSSQLYKSHLANALMLSLNFP